MKMISLLSNVNRILARTAWLGGVFALVLICLFIEPFIGIGQNLTGLAEARSMDEEAEIRWLLYKRYFFYGSIGLEYEKQDKETTQNGVKTDFNGDSFVQRYRLNFKSYIYHPKLVTYTLGVDWSLASGELNKVDLKRYFLNLKFLRTKPFNFEIRAEYRDGGNYQGFSQGITMTYRRKRKKVGFRNMREYTLWLNQQRMNQRNRNQNQNQNLNQNQNRNNSNLNQENLNQEAPNQNQNQNQNVLNRSLPKPRRSFLDRILPVVFIFDFDRFQTSADDGDSTDYLGNLRMKGDFKTEKTFTNYFLNFAYYDFNRDNGEDTSRFRAEAKTITNINKSDKMEWEARYSLREDRSSESEYGVHGSYYGYFRNKVWNYRVSLKYNQRESNANYSLIGDAGRKDTFKGFHLLYRLGAKYQHDDLIDRDNIGVFGTISASKKLSDRQSLILSSRLETGTETTILSARAETRYRLSQAFRLFAIYHFFTSKGNYTYEFGGAANDRTRHQLNIGVNGYVKSVFLSSSVTYNYEDSRSSVLWDASARTVFFNRVRFTLGLKANWKEEGSVDIASDETDTSGNTTTLSAYNMIAFSPWYRAAFRIYSRYEKTLNGDESTHYSVEPELLWRIRRLYITLRYQYLYDKGLDIETKEQKFYVRLTRPFWF